MQLSKLLEGLQVTESVNDLNLDITNVHSDSRMIEANGLFVAINGYLKKGIEFLDSAISNGAVAALVEDDVDISSLPQNITYIKVKETQRRALAILNCNLYDNPSKKFKLIGVTGTKGKTTTTYMIKSLLEAHGLKVGLIGSIAIYIGNEKIKETDRTTPEADEVQYYLSQMADANVDAAVIEVSSQALKLDRVYGCDFDIGVFTNLTEDHISKNEHADMEEYFNCKCMLFDMAPLGIINVDDSTVRTILDKNKTCKFKTFGLDNKADLMADKSTLKITPMYIDFTANIDGKDENFEVSIPGKFSVYNSLGAISVAREFGVTPDEMRKALKNLKVLGRNELVPNKLGLSIIIDYAHTPSSLQSILESVKAYAKGRVICAWGVGGDRDATKRPIMGEISGRLADYTILMSDQVRTEDPLKILKEIEVGVIKSGGKYELIVDRTQGIRRAIEIAEKDDIIVIPGLGSDLYLEKDHVKHFYDERQVIAELIDEMIANGEKKPVNE